MKYLLILIVIIISIQYTRFSFAQDQFNQVIRFIADYCYEGSNINYCIQGIYNLIVALAVVVAFIMFIIGAFKNLLSVVPDVKMEGKNQMRNSIIGLIVIFSSGVLLYWINPEIFNARLLMFRVESLQMPGVEIVAEMEDAVPIYSDIAVKFNRESDLVPIKIFGNHTVTVHRDFAPKLENISKRWKELGGDNFYRIDSVSGYAWRNVRGGNKLSAHAFGLAIDINPKQNPYVSKDKFKQTKRFITDMPKAFVQLFIDEGVGWGGNWINLKDPMHFSLIKSENENLHIIEWGKIRQQLPDKQQPTLIEVTWR